MQIQQHVQARLAAQRANIDMDEADPIPRVEITGENYEVGGSKKVLADAIGWVRSAFFILLFVGEACFQPFGGLRQMPAFVRDTYNVIQENKIQAGLFAFFIGSMVQTQLLQSGAFEIYINDNLEFSKLHGGHMPTL